MPKEYFSYSVDLLLAETWGIPAPESLFFRDSYGEGHISQAK